MPISEIHPMSKLWIYKVFWKVNNPSPFSLRDPNTQNPSANHRPINGFMTEVWRLCRGHYLPSLTSVHRAEGRSLQPRRQFLPFLSSLTPAYLSSTGKWHSGCSLPWGPGLVCWGWVELSPAPARGEDGPAISTFSLLPSLHSAVNLFSTKNSHLVSAYFLLVPKIEHDKYQSY